MVETGTTMHNRLRLLRLITALLYSGPLLAGLMGQGWAMVAAFACVFVIFSVVLHPEHWPRSSDDMARSEAAVAMLSLVATQVLLVIAGFAVGRGIGGVLALKPALPAYAPLALSAVAVPLARLVWNPAATVDPVGFAPGPQPDAPREVDPPAQACAFLDGVSRLPEDVAEDILQSHLTAVSTHLDPVLIRQTLAEAVASGTAGPAPVKALIVHATDPAVSDLMAGSAYPAQAFAAAGQDDDLLGLFARRCTLMLEDEPDLAADCPSGAQVAMAASASQDPATAAELHRLAGLLP